MNRPTLRKRRTKGGEFSRLRQAWADTVLGTFAYLRIPFKPAPPDLEGFLVEPGDTIRLEIPGLGDTYTSLDLSKCTSLELDYIEATFARAIAAARPICEERDRHAAQAAEQGQDHYARIYRAVPQFFVRERPRTEHDAGVPDGLTDVP